MSVITIDRRCPDVTAATRRQLMVGLGSLGLLTAGCAGEPEAPATPPRTEVVEHQFGSTDIPASVQRVVTLGFTDHDAVLALGIVPLGLNRWYEDMERGVGSWAEHLLGKQTPEIVCNWTDIDYEAIAALAPDLIIGLYFDMTREAYDRLSKIAPTVAPPRLPIPYAIDWRTQTRTVGTALNKTDEATKLIADVDLRIKQLREQHPEFAGVTVNYVRPSPGGEYFAYTASDARIRLLTDLGLTLSPQIADLEQNQFTVGISEEQINLLDAACCPSLVPRTSTAIGCCAVWMPCSARP